MSGRSASPGGSAAQAGPVPPDGILLVDKPAGVSSHDVVAAVRRAFGGRRAAKVGHAGTLDPFATGLLVVLVGRATRIQSLMMELRKRYEVTARFGAVSSTGDPEGEIRETGLVPDGDLRLPTGTVRQRPPAYSAVKVGGRRAYALARAGEAVELPEREIVVHRFEETRRCGATREYLIECSSGTYVRSLIAELGDAYCTALRRTRIGAFDVTGAPVIPPAPDALARRIVPIADALGFLPSVRLEPGDARRAAHGVRVPIPADAALQGGTIVLADEDGPIALARVQPGGDEARPYVGFRG